MAITDYDAPRVRDQSQTDEQYVRQLTTTRRSQENVAIAETDQVDNSAFVLNLDGLDLADELVGAVITQQADEFTCSGCFLILPQRRRVPTSQNRPLCSDCA